MRAKSTLAAMMLASIVLFPSAAAAMCNLPDDVARSALRAAEWTVENSDIVGFAIVKQRQDVSRHQPEVLHMVFPLKGQAGLVTMDLQMNGTAQVVTGGTATSFDQDEGSLVLAALKVRPTGAIVSECQQLVFARHPKDKIASALFSIWNGGTVGSPSSH